MTQFDLKKKTEKGQETRLLEGCKNELGRVLLLLGLLIYVLGTILIWCFYSVLQSELSRVFLKSVNTKVFKFHQTLILENIDAEL